MPLALREKIAAGDGKAKIKTVEGEPLTFSLTGDNHILITDEKGDTARISTANVFQSNGVIQVIDKVLMP